MAASASSQLLRASGIRKTVFGLRVYGFRFEGLGFRASGIAFMIKREMAEWKQHEELSTVSVSRTQSLGTANTWNSTFWHW